MLVIGAGERSSLLGDDCHKLPSRQSKRLKVSSEGGQKYGSKTIRFAVILDSRKQTASDERIALHTRRNSPDSPRTPETAFLGTNLFDIIQYIEDRATEDLNHTSTHST